MAQGEPGSAWDARLDSQGTRGPTTLLKFYILMCVIPEVTRGVGTTWIRMSRGGGLLKSCQGVIASREAHRGTELGENVQRESSMTQEEPTVVGTSQLVGFWRKPH